MLGFQTLQAETTQNAEEDIMRLKFLLGFYSKPMWSFAITINENWNDKWAISYKLKNLLEAVKGTDFNLRTKKYFPKKNRQLTFQKTFLKDCNIFYDWSLERL